MKKVSERMLELRDGMTQAEAGKRIGKTQQVWARYESGAVKPNAEMILQICSAFDVSADWLLGLTDERTPGGADASDARIAELEKKIIRLEGEKASLQTTLDKTLALLHGGHHAHPAKTGGSSATKTA